MTTPVIQPTAIYPPGYTPPVTSNTPPYSPPPKPPLGQRTLNRIPAQNPTASLPGKLPGFLRNPILNNRAIVFNTWVIAMITVGFDEWHNLGIMPRPARLWDTSLVYGLLVMLGFVDVMVPIANALAIGFTVMLLWQYFGGNLTPAGGTGQNATQAAQAALQPVGYSGTATVPATATTTGANPTGGAPTLNGA